MRNRMHAVGLALCLGLCAVSTARTDGPPPASADATPAALAIGASAPMASTAMSGVDGRTLSIAEAGGKKGTLVIFMCHHCPWVKAWQGRIARIGSAAAKQGVGVIAINSNDPVAYPEDDLDGMKAQAKQLKLTFPYVIDATSDVARAFGATRTPEAFLFDKSGKLVYHGTIDDNAHDEKAVSKPWLEQAVNAVAGGQAVPTAETKAFGCGIKFREKTGT
ncbi:MAG: thioredoxin family protein [Candidatus Eiseniibacteriota bacterium]